MQEGQLPVVPPAAIEGIARALHGTMPPQQASQALTAQYPRLLRLAQAGESAACMHLLLLRCAKGSTDHGRTQS